MVRFRTTQFLGSLTVTAFLASCGGEIGEVGSELTGEEGIESTETEIVGTEMGTDLESVQNEVLINDTLSFSEAVKNGVKASSVLLHSLRGSGMKYQGVAGTVTNTAWKTWFDNADSGNRTLHAEIMQHLVACGLPSGRSVTYQYLTTIYTWSGKFGLAGAAGSSDWGVSKPTDPSEIRKISGCMFAHITSGTSATQVVQLSVRGDGASGSGLEKQVQASFDGAFFGDLHDGLKWYICKNTWLDKAPNPDVIKAPITAPTNYSVLLSEWGRQCLFSTNGCGGLFAFIDCSSICSAAYSTTGYHFGPTCSYGGQTYSVYNAYLPKFMVASKWLTPTGAIPSLVSCTSCVDSWALSLAAGSVYQAGGWSTSTGAVSIMIKYATTSTATIKLWTTNSTGGSPVVIKNGTATTWSFSSTGGSNTWKTKTIALSSFPANGKIRLEGVTGTLRVNLVSMKD